ncbi:MAG: hypothetical protein ACFBSG_01390 [Leptolyngbyaceae cyanobacterium]
MELHNLRCTSSQQKRSDASQSMVKYRNIITHPDKENRELFLSLSRDFKIDVWKLCVWSLELLLLRLFEYEGIYANRIKRQYGVEIELVPWGQNSGS